MPVHERARIAVDENAILFIDIHSDAYSDIKAKGVTIIGAIETEQDIELGNIIAKSVAESMGTYNRGYMIKRGENGRLNWYGAIHYSYPVKYRFIVERGFHTNLDDLEKLKDSANIELTAKNLANDITSYFNRQ